MPRDASGTLIGCPEPRLFTPPLRPLTAETTRGYSLIEFAKVVGVPLLPWQETLAIRSLEIHPNGRPRYAVVTVLVGRQSGKSRFAALLALWAMYIDGAQLVVGAAQSLDISTEAWRAAVNLASEHPELSGEVATIRRTNGQQQLELTSGARYRIAATSAGAGRGLSCDLLLMDEARMQRDHEAWASLSKTTIARPGARIFVLSNAGGDEAVLLNSLRDSALSGRDESIGLFEWSADPALDIADPESWAQGCPGLGHIVDEASIRAALATDPAPIFRSEIRCERVSALHGAVDLAQLQASIDPSARLDHFRDRVALCVAVSGDGRHATLVAAALGDDRRVIVEPVAAWSSPSDAARDIPGWRARLKPSVFGWFGGGAGAVLAADLRDTDAVEIKGTATIEACAGLAEKIAAGEIRHAGDPLLTAHLGHAIRVRQGDGWRFGEPVGGAHIDAAFAAAGAVHLARTVPAKADRVVHIW